ncbi:hypothetical protein ACP179_18295 [Xenorhabdus stockiae]|uniref:hypothetical protein n=1 Tax=Xenorhabdus stockiae TaxID=351614 RepID=UPI003CE793F2
MRYYLTVKTSVSNANINEYCLIHFIIESESEHAASFRVLTRLHYMGYQDCEILDIKPSQQDKINRLIHRRNAHLPNYH